MRIGYDAKWYFDGPASGRIVVRRHLDALSATGAGHSVVAILDKRHEGRPMDGPAEALERTWTWGGNNLLANSLRLASVARAARLDALVVHNFSPIRPSCTTIAFVHDLLFLEYPQFYTRKERLYFAPLRWLSTRASRVCTPSSSERARMVRIGLAPENQIDVVPLGVDRSFTEQAGHDAALLAHAKKKLALPDRFILFVGRINDRKNLANLLEAVSLLRDQSVPLVVAGTRDWKSADPALRCRELNIADRVRFLGSIDQDTLPLVYALATVFVFPSWAEGFGLPPLEAMSSGVPVVVSNRTSVPEVCGDAAIYCDPTSPPDIAQKIDSVLSDSGLQERLKLSGIARSRSFTWERSASTLIESVERASGLHG